jgi:hypothetical protein
MLPEGFVPNLVWPTTIDGRADTKSRLGNSPRTRRSNSSLDAV